MTVNARAPFDGGDGSSGGGGGPEGPQGPRAFAVGYQRHSGDMMVYGGGALTLVGVLAAVVNASPALLLVSVVGSLSALYFVPTIDPSAPQLGAGAQGLFVAPFGVIAWDAIDRLEVQRHALRTMHLATLHVDLNRPLEQALVAAHQQPGWMRYAARNARRTETGVRASLHTLQMPVDTIESRLLAFWRPRKGA